MTNLHVFVLLAVTAIGLYLCYLMAVPFVPALTWALALAVLFMPLQRWLESRLRQPDVAAGVSVLLLGLTVVVPATFMAQRLVSEAVTGAETIRVMVNRGNGRCPRRLPTRRGVRPAVRAADRSAGHRRRHCRLAHNAFASFVTGLGPSAVGVVLTFYLFSTSCVTDIQCSRHCAPCRHCRRRKWTRCSGA